jgi:hypothetical protein
MVNVVDGDNLVRQEFVGAVVEHGGGEILHVGLGLHVQVSNHDIAIDQGFG